MAIEDWPLLPSWLRRERRLLLLLLSAALLLRVGAALGSRIIHTDGTRFTESVRHLHLGEIDRALSVYPHLPPLYPMLTDLVSRGVKDIELAGALVSALFGTLAILPLFFLTKEIAGARVAAVAGLLYAFLPEVAVLEGEVMCEGVLLFFFLSWMLLAWRCAEEPRWDRFVLAALAASATFLTRPEGIYTVAGMIGWCAIRGWRSPARTAAGVAGFLATFLCCIYPYLLWVHAKSGAWKLTVSPLGDDFFRRLEGQPPQAFVGYETFLDEETEYKEVRAQKRFGKVGGALISVARDASRVCFHVFLPLGFLGLFLARRRGWKGHGILLLVLMVCGYALPTVVGVAIGNPLSYRYVLPSCVFAAPFLALGTMEALSWSSRRIPVAWLTVGAAALLLVMAGKIVKPRRGDKADLKSAGLRIRAEFGPGRRIAAMDRRVFHYAESEFSHLPARFENRPLDAELLVLWLHRMDHMEPGYREKVETGYRLVHEIGDVQVYSVR